MLILDENNNTILLHKLTAPVVSEYVWVLNFEMMDFCLSPLNVLEEVTCPTLTVEINNFEFQVPAHWFMLIFDLDTSQLDVIQFGSAAGGDFNAVKYGNNCNNITAARPRVTNYSPSETHVTPSLNKHTMLCHPISPTTWINISPNDSFNKYLKNATIGDLI